MSTDTFIHLLYGIPLYNQSQSLAEKLAVIFPEFAQDFTDEEGKVADAEKFLEKLSRMRIFIEKFPGVRMQVTKENYVLIVLAGSDTTLYYKYYVNCDGISLPDKDRPSKKPLKKFAKELGLVEKPQSIVWSYEDDLDDEDSWVTNTLY
jgi:hypothetical protein